MNNSGIHMRGTRLVMPFLSCLITVILAFAAGSASAATRGECAGRCSASLCGDGYDPVCGTIYDNCMISCMNGTAQTAPPPLPDVWGALAVSPSTLDWGNSWNYKSKQAAETEALKACRNVKGARDCKLAVTVADVCVALAVSSSQKIVRVGGPIGAVNFAEANAMLKCKRAGGRNCAVATSFCADGVKHVLNGNTVFPNGNPIFVPSGQSTTLRR